MSGGAIFVFGSNLGGRHGKGAALDALRLHGATYGQGIGPQGNSYAIPTKDRTLRTLDLDAINGYVHDFLQYARLNPHLTFHVTAIGTGLAGYSPLQIAPMFRERTANVILPVPFLEALEFLYQEEHDTRAERLSLQ